MGLTLPDPGEGSSQEFWNSKHELGRKRFVGSKADLRRQEIAKGVQETKACSVAEEIWEK